MSYWSGEKLLEEIKNHKLIFPFESGSIDCASYTLQVGDEAFVSKDFSNTESSAAIKQNLSTTSSSDIVHINPGQFAFLLTYENVTVPDYAIAFISIKSKYKFRGLINVSGFHIDPGYSGKLIFGVYNAGPMPIILQRREPVFLIFYADLDRSSRIIYTGKSQARNGIGSDLIQNMAGQVFSPLLLQRKIERLEDAQLKLDKEQSTLVTRATFAVWFAGVALGGIVSLGALLFNSTTAQVMFGGWIKSAIEANTDYKSQISVPNKDILQPGIPSKDFAVSKSKK